MKYKTQEERLVGYNARQKRYYLKHREILLSKQKAWQQTHKEYCREYARNHYVKHRVVLSKVVTCKNCYTQFKIFPSRINKNGNFCCRDCSKQYVDKHRTDPILIKQKIKESRKAYWAKRNAPRILENFQKRQKRKVERNLLKILKKIVSAKGRKELVENKCQHCGLVFKTRYPHKFCSKKCNGQSKFRGGRKGYLKRHPEKKVKHYGISKERFQKIKEKFGYRCAICGEKEPFLDQYWHYLTQDHIVPRSKGGSKYTEENIQPACWNCNIKKSDEYSPQDTRDIV